MHEMKEERVVSGPPQISCTTSLHSPAQFTSALPSFNALPHERMASESLKSYKCGRAGVVLFNLVNVTLVTIAS